MFLKIDKKKIQIDIAKSYTKRLFGLMGKKEIDYGILFPKCNSIHTFFMKDEIDMIGLNEENQVIYIYRNLPKNKIVKISHDVKKTSILELPKNTGRKIQIGSVLFFEDKDVV